jgi:hypothetical protein
MELKSFEKYLEKRLTKQEITKMKKDEIPPEALKWLKNQELKTKAERASSIGSRHGKVIPRAKGAVKSKATFCLDTVAVEQLNQIYIQRLKDYQKSDRSSLICEAISLLYAMEQESTSVDPYGDD